MLKRLSKSKVVLNPDVEESQKSYDLGAAVKINESTSHFYPRFFSSLFLTIKTLKLERKPLTILIRHKIEVELSSLF